MLPDLSRMDDVESVAGQPSFVAVPAVVHGLRSPLPARQPTRDDHTAGRIPAVDRIEGGGPLQQRCQTARPGDDHLRMVLLRLATIVLAVALAAALHQLADARAEAATEAELRIQGERAADEKIALVTGSREDFRREMQAISSEVLKGATTEVAKLNDERAKTLGDAVKPVAEHLAKLDQRVEELQAERARALATMQEMFATTTAELGKLRGETGALVSALKRPQVRGSWGEIQLKNVARIADGGRLRPDMTVHLPTGRDIVVDSKVPLDAYLVALEAADDTARDTALDRHAAQLRTHLDALAAKSYHAKLERSAEFVVCFIPNEACYVAALDRDPSLLEHGAAKGVLIATPTTLLALLHATHYGWRQAEVEQSALEIAAAGRELHKRFGTFLESFAKVGRQLGSETDAYNAAVGPGRAAAASGREAGSCVPDSRPDLGPAGRPRRRSRLGTMQGTGTLRGATATTTGRLRPPAPPPPCRPGRASPTAAPPRGARRDRGRRAPPRRPPRRRSPSRAPARRRAPPASPCARPPRSSRARRGSRRSARARTPSPPRARGRTARRPRQGPAPRRR
jgi:DNA recombination protein RmuC